MFYIFMILYTLPLAQGVDEVTTEVKLEIER